MTSDLVAVAPDQALVSAQSLEALAGAVLESTGVASACARLVAESLVSADLEGVSSHGVALLPLYVERIRKGSVDVRAEPKIAEDLGGLLVVDAGNALGQVSSRFCVDLGIERARAHGISFVSVRHAFHFGTASYWARQFAHAGMVGLAFSNTRPLMPAPGGAERVVGNNPVAIAFPCATGQPLVVDMAMSATAMGRIRIAESRKQDIPLGWATDAQGHPTTSPAEAIKGMLLPAAGPKGFGLAVAIDLLCGAMSGGAVGAAVRPLYAELDKPYDCSHAFICIDASRLNGGSGITSEVAGLADAIRHSKRAAGSQVIHAPGDLERSRRAASNGRCVISTELATQLHTLAEQAGVPARLDIH